MTGKLIVASLATIVALSASFANAEERKKMELLDPADGPCLFLLDENLNEYGDPVNPPCDLGGVIVNPGDPINAADRRKYGKPAPTDDSSVEAGSVSPRDAASGMPTGRR